VVDGAKEFILKFGSERAAERETRKTIRMLNDAKTDSKELSEEFAANHRLDKLYSFIQDKDN